MERTLHLIVSDLLVVCHVPFIAYFTVYRKWVFGRLVCRLYYYAENANKIISTLILTAMSWDRYIAVCHAAASYRFRSPSLLLLPSSPQPG